MRRDVAAVREGVDPRALGREPQQRLQVLEVGVHAAARDQTEQVHVAAPVERRLQSGVLEEGAVRDRTVDPLQVLVEHAPRADRQVADLRVPHLARRSPTASPGALIVVCGHSAQRPVEDGCLGQLDRVPRAWRRAAPAVEDDQDYRSAAIRHSAVNDSTSSEAPPTRAPSTPSCESSCCAFSGLTEPP